MICVKLLNAEDSADTYFTGFVPNASPDYVQIVLSLLFPRARIGFRRVSVTLLRFWMGFPYVPDRFELESGLGNLVDFHLNYHNPIINGKTVVVLIYPTLGVLYVDDLTVIIPTPILMFYGREWLLDLVKNIQDATNIPKDELHISIREDVIIVDLYYEGMFRVSLEYESPYKFEFFVSGWCE